MKSGGVGLILAITTAGIAGALLALNPAWAEPVLLVGLLGAGVALVSTRLTTPEDSKWLPKLILLAYGAKIGASILRYLTVTVLYDRADAFGYHGAAMQLVESWRDLSVPVLTEGGGAGTRFTELITSLLYVPYVPSMLGGFFIFATLAFVGQLFFYAAFRTLAPMRQWRVYAVLVFFVPTLLFWPSSIGKESLMLLFLGVSAYGVARLMDRPTFRYALISAAAIALAGAIRPHVAMLVVGSATLALVLSRSREGQSSWVLRVGVLVLAIIGLAVTYSTVTERFGVTLETESVEPFIQDLERRTEDGGSGVEGESVRNPMDVPSAFLRVLFRPLPHEAHNPQALLSSLENLVLLSFTIWRVPAMFRSFHYLRGNPYLLLSLFFVLAFIIAFSPVLNLGILARQRSQAIPFLLAVLVGVGRRPDADDVTPRYPALEQLDHAR